jgi:hypothetical protein
MRLRLFNVSEQASKQPVIFDRFPASVVDPAKWTCGMSAADQGEECLIEEIDGTLYAISTGRSLCPRLNGDEFESTPMLPGDRLTLGSTTFVVSYERMTCDEPAPFPSRKIIFDSPQSSPWRPHFDEPSEEETDQFEEPAREFAGVPGLFASSLLKAMLFAIQAISYDLRLHKIFPGIGGCDKLKLVSALSFSGSFYRSFPHCVRGHGRLN